ncbi:sensor domain-containing diguanylate cyclase [Anaeromyxobacter terrae]|uniref:sensor domain-containing diguanylate cyclase n=1 Tax=Anaeromyxobacter terrae TaxID=2925406 RepID=UPI001F574B4F|nr:diguanylate cyclase [Anaeromyxobacter sp. SG22]
MTAPPGAAHRAPIGATPTVRRRLALQRPRPLLVRVYAALFSDGGTFGAPARRRAGRLLLRSLTPAVTVGTGGLVVLGAFDAAAPGWPQTAGTAALAAALGAGVWRRTARAAAGEAATLREQLELGALFVVAAYAMAQTASAGHVDSPLQPLVYLVMAFLVAFLARRIGLALVVIAVALELLVWFGRGGHAEELPSAVVRAGFVTLFALLYHAVLAAQVGSSRRAEERAVERRVKELEERAREFRLTASGTGAPAAGGDADGRWTVASVLEVENAMRGALEVAEVALRSHTCAVYLLDDAGERLQLRECRTASDSLARGVSAREGALGAAIARRTSVRLHGDVKVATYYEDGARPGALVVVPLIDRRGGYVRGVIVADRREPIPFSDEDEKLVQTLCAEIFRALEAERVMGDIKSTRDEKERFYDAIDLLNRTRTPDEVFRTITEVAGRIVTIDAAAVTLVEQDGQERAHRVAAVHGQRLTALAGKRVIGGDGLVQKVVEHDTTLPAASVDPARATLLDASSSLKGLGWVRVVPLRAAGEVLGTVVLAGVARDRAPSVDQVRQLEVVAGQAAQSILRARLYEEAERLATTDGLTGLTNHRTFQARLDEHLALAARGGQRLSLLLCDVDHFKSVNDTYGHPVGDEVLRGVARVLAGEARQTDVVARYGGEEFAIVMPGTDAPGAGVIAERIRERLAAVTFQTEQGPLRVTMSLGVATWPEDGAKKPELVERADACLYHAKRHGRNQTVLAATIRAHRRAAG